LLFCLDFLFVGADSGTAFSLAFDRAPGFALFGLDHLTRDLIGLLVLLAARTAGREVLVDQYRDFIVNRVTIDSFGRHLPVCHAKRQPLVDYIKWIASEKLESAGLERPDDCKDGEDDY
jgi:hypothetical protein